MALSEEQVKQVDDGIASLTSMQSLVEGAAEGFEGTVSSAAWWVGVVSPGFLGLLWNAKELSELTWLPMEAYFTAFAAAQLFFVLSIIGAMVVHARHADAIGTMREHSLNILGWVAGLQNVKRIGKPDDALLRDIDAMRVKVVDFDFDMKESAVVKAGVDYHRWAGGMGYVVLVLILLTLWFPGPTPKP
jgi:hypothetical protein